MHEISRRRFIKTGVSAAFALNTPWLLNSCRGIGETKTGSTQPNILFILTDDQGWPTLGSYGGGIVATPNLDRLAAQGARFTQARVVEMNGMHVSGGKRHYLETRTQAEWYPDNAESS